MTDTTLIPAYPTPVEAAPTRELTTREELFVSYYTGEALGNATRAATLAGYTGSYHTIANSAQELIKNPVVLSHIRAYVDSVGVTNERIMLETAHIAFRDPSEFVQEVRNQRGELVELRMDLSPKMKALELLMKCRRMIGADVNVNVTNVKALIGVDLSRL